MIYMISLITTPNSSIIFNHNNQTNHSSDNKRTVQTMNRDNNQF